MSDDQKALCDNGFVILPALLSADELAAARDHADALLRDVEWSDNDFDGRRTRRVYSLLHRLGAFERLVLHPATTALIAGQLGDERQLGMLLLAAVDPGQGAQMLHFDAGVYPLPRDIEAETNVIWALDDFTATNGATLIAPGSHAWPAGRRARLDEMIPAVMPAGSALVYSGRLWHAAGANNSDQTRRAVISEQVLPWLRPADNHALALGADGLRDLSPELQALAGLGTNSKYFGFVGGRPAAEWLTVRG
jgi:ectoine hydroxylase-related dioxygenase (phytanoyl-CoA dioxygenase family)